MTRTRASFALTVLAFVIACAGLAPAAQADSTPRFSLAVDRHSVRSGQPLTVTGTATTACTWLLEWNGERRIGRDRAAFTASFTAPQVSRPTRMPVQGTCFYDSPASRPQHGSDPRNTQPPSSTSRSTIVVRIPPSWRHTVVVTVLPPRSAVSAPGTAGGPGHPGDGLPGTGGPALWLLLTGLGAVLAGSVAVRSSPRRLAA